MIEATVQLSATVGCPIGPAYVHPMFVYTCAVGAHVIVGLVLSSTVTVAEQVVMLPLLSLTVSTTVFAPRLLQSNALGLTDNN